MDVCFWHRHPFLTPWPVASVEDPAVAVPASEGNAPQLPSGAGTGAAGTLITSSAPPLAALAAGDLPGDPTSPT